MHRRSRLASSAERHRLLRDWIDRGAEMVRVDDTPDFLLPLISALRHAQPNQFSINDLPADEIADRQAAVLILLGGQGPNGIEVVMIQRASGLRDHPGEISFPGGSWEQGDTSPVDTAARGSGGNRRRPCRGYLLASSTPSSTPVCSSVRPDSTSAQSSDTGTSPASSRRPTPPKLSGRSPSLSTNSPSRADGWSTPSRAGVARVHVWTAASCCGATPPRY